MTVIHKVCGTEVKSSGKGDWGICPKCNCRVDHLVIKNGQVAFSDDVTIDFNATVGEIK